jgi:hypothetical protein
MLGRPLAFHDQHPAARRRGVIARVHLPDPVLEPAMARGGDKYNRGSMKVPHRAYLEQ